jgi:hypothetical protein
MQVSDCTGFRFMQFLVMFAEKKSSLRAINFQMKVKAAISPPSPVGPICLDSPPCSRR